MQATFTATAPTTVAAGDPLQLTNATITLTIDSGGVSALSSFADSASGTLNKTPLDVTGGSTPTVDIAGASGLAFGPYSISSAMNPPPLTLTIPANGFSVSLGTASAGAGTAAISLDTAPAYTQNGSTYTPTGAGIVATVNATRNGSPTGVADFYCTAPTTQLGTITVTSAGVTSSSSSPASGGATTTTSTTTTATTTGKPVLKPAPKVCYGYVTKRIHGKNVKVKVKVTCPKPKVCYGKNKAGKKIKITCPKAKKK